MTPLQLTSRFRRRMALLVAIAAVPIAAAAPVAFAVLESRELLREARTDAAHAIDVVRAAVAERPRLWRYDAVRLGERFAAEGLDRRPLRVVVDGHAVPVDAPRAAPPLPARAVWGRAELPGEDLPVVDAAPTPRVAVWVAADAGPIYRGTALLALLFAGLAGLLGAVLYLVPVRVVTDAELRAHALLGKLALALQESDRRRIGRDLHDGAGQALTAARLQLLALGSAAPPETVRRIAEHLDAAIDEVRRTSAALGPPALAERGLPAALAQLCESYAGTTLTVRCRAGGPGEEPLPTLAPEFELALYRVAQEALANVARHARASHAALSLEVQDRRLRLVVEDDGVGPPDPAEALYGRGGGLAGVRERLGLLGGALRISPPGRALRLVAELPLANGGGGGGA